MSEDKELSWSEFFGFVIKQVQSSEYTSLLGRLFEDLDGYKEITKNNPRSVEDWGELILRSDALCEVVDGSVPVYNADRLQALQKGGFEMARAWDNAVSDGILDPTRPFFECLGVAIYQYNLKVLSDFIS